MPADTLKTDAYVHYEFVTIKCNTCETESNPFVYKEHLDADELLVYLEEITGFSVYSNPDAPRKMRLTATDQKKGGMICPICKEAEAKEK